MRHLELYGTGVDYTRSAWDAAKVTANPTPLKSKAAGWGPVSRYVADNLVRLRKARGLSTTRLAAELKEIGHSIPATGITRIEKGERRVDVDDLAALAVALKVSPTAFLLPPTLVGTVEVAPKRSVPAVEAWMWATSRQPLGLPTGGEERRAALDDHQVHSLPPGIRRWSPGEVGMSLDDQAMLVAQMEHISFREAREKVYGRAGAQLPESEGGNL
jgi:transcriptional regulator with XRE-family HTH domain